MSWFDKQNSLLPEDCVFQSSLTINIYEIYVLSWTFQFFAISIGGYKNLGIIRLINIIQFLSADGWCLPMVVRIFVNFFQYDGTILASLNWSKIIIHFDRSGLSKTMFWGQILVSYLMKICCLGTNLFTIQTEVTWSSHQMFLDF